MKIGTIDTPALDIAISRTAELAREIKQPAAAETAKETAPATLGLDLSGLGDAHSLDADRVAALIADPFGEE